MISAPAWKCTAFSVSLPTAVMVTLPPLPLICTAALTISSVTTPGVRITWSASWPHVVSTTKSCASLAEANACVAPKTDVAMSRLKSTGSTTTTFLAPAYRAPCTALLPTPPAPKITTVPRPDARGVDRRAPSGGDAAADQAGHLEGDVVGERDGRPLGHDRVLGEGAQGAEPAEVFVAQVEAEGAVEEHAGPGVEALDAHVLVPGRAGTADAAGRDVGADHPV